MKEKYKPIVGITIGDPAGIGPEIILKALGEKHIYDECRPLVIGCVNVLERAKAVLPQCSLEFNRIESVSDACFRFGSIDVLETGHYDISKLVWGKEQADAGQIAMDSIRTSIELGLEGEIDAVTTAPINKVAIKMVGVKQAGHTEIYMDGTKAPYVLTMFDCFKMRVFHLSRHISLMNAIRYATKEHVLNDICRIDKELKRLGMETPYIAVAGINPHSGEGGLFGDEEMKEIIPAIEEARKRGIIFDTAEGRKHGDFDVMLKAKEQGFIADMCSTDLVLGSMFRRPIFSLPNLMSRYICMGIPMSQVVSMATERPAGLMKMQGEIGCLSEGARADVAIFRWMDFKQTYKDWKGTAFTADKLLKPEMTVKDGQIMYCAPDYIYEDWV